MKTTVRIAAWAALLLTAPLTALAQGIRAENVPRSGLSPDTVGAPRSTGPSATVGVRENYDSPEKELQRMIRGAEYHLDRADKLFAAGQYAPACRSLASAKNLVITAELGSRWAGLCSQLQKIGAEQFAKAEGMFQKGDYQEALDEFKRIAATFVGLPVAQAARKCLIDARDDPEVQAAINETRAAKLFEALAAQCEPTTAPTTRPANAPPRRQAVTAKAILALDDEPFLRAVDALEGIAKSFGGAPTAAKAGAILQSILADAAAKDRLQRLRRDQQAEQALAKARQYQEVGMTEKAAGLYRQVIEDFPNTPQAAQADGYLGTLRLASPTK
ncbi:MAG TPA: hypothetical protein VM389_01310 [Phycisphaerae bacterium]|nr:hypothetical protein [Phycisphaerae bacterium]